MASIVVAGDTSGTVTLTAPLVAGTTTLTLPTANGTLITTGSSGQSIPRAALPAGSVLQVASTTKTNIYSSNHGETWADITGFSVNITPTSASSRIFISVTCGTSLEEQDSFAFLRLMRDSTSICVGDARGSATRASMDASQQTAGTTRVWAKPNAVQFLDSPATTSQITYKVQAWIRSGRTLFVGGTSGTDDAYRSNLPSIITVMEIAA